MSTGFKRQGTAVGANAPSSPYAKTSKAPKPSKHHHTPQDTEFRRFGASVGPGSSSPAGHSDHHSHHHDSHKHHDHHDHHDHHHKSGVGKEVHHREKLDRKAHKEEKNHSKKKKKSFWASLCGGSSSSHKSKHHHSHHDHHDHHEHHSQSKHKISAHDTGFQKSVGSGVGPHTSHGNNTHHTSPAQHHPFCDQCGTKLPPGVAKFCDHCGAKVRS